VQGNGNKKAAASGFFVFNLTYVYVAFNLPEADFKLSDFT